MGRRRSRVRLRGVLTSCKVACRKCFSTEHFLRLIPDHLGLGLGPRPRPTAAATADGKQRDDMTDPQELNPGQTDRHLASGLSRRSQSDSAPRWNVCDATVGRDRANSERIPTPPGSLHLNPPPPCLETACSRQVRAPSRFSKVPS